MNGPPPPSDSICDVALSVESLQRFIQGLPERTVVLRYPYWESQIDLSQLKGRLSTIGDQEYLYDDTRNLVVTKAEKTAGWLCLSFHWAYWSYFMSNSRNIAAVAGQPLCSELDLVIGRTLAHYEVGMTKTTLRNLLPPLVHCRDRLARQTTQHPGALYLLSEPINHLSQALTIWESDPGYSNWRFWGGGFGIQGAIEGMGMAHLLNSFVDQYNKRIALQHNARVSMPLEYGFQHLKSTHSALLGFP